MLLQLVAVPGDARLGELRRELRERAVPPRAEARGRRRGAAPHARRDGAQGLARIRTPVEARVRKNTKRLKIMQLLFIIEVPVMLLIRRFRKILRRSLSRWVSPKSNVEVSGLVFSCIETKLCKKILVGIRIYLKRRLRKRGRLKKENMIEGT